MNGINSSEVIIDLIRRLRNKNGMSVEELSNRVGIAKSTLSRYENKKRDFPINDVGKYANVFGVSVEYLLGLESNDAKSASENHYFYYPTSVSAGDLATIENTEAEQISISDTIMGRYAGSEDIYFISVNGDSMNKIIPHGSLIGVKKIDLDALRDDDIVLFRNNYEYSVKRYFNDVENKRHIFRAESTNRSFIDNIVPYEESNGLVLCGKVILYIVRP